MKRNRFLALIFSSALVSAGATQLDETVTGVVFNVLNRTGLPTSVAVGDSFVAHLYIDTDQAPPPNVGTFGNIWSDVSLSASGAGPQWLEFSLSFNGRVFFDSRLSGYDDGDQRVMKILDQPNASINGHPAFTDIYTVSSDKKQAGGNHGQILLDTSTRSLDRAHFFSTTALAEEFIAPQDLGGNLFDFVTGPVGRNLNVNMNVSSLSVQAIPAPVQAVPEPSTVLLTLAGGGLLLLRYRRGRVNPAERQVNSRSLRRQIRTRQTT